MACMASVEHMLLPTQLNASAFNSAWQEKRNIFPIGSDIFRPLDEWQARLGKALQTNRTVNSCSVMVILCSTCWHTLLLPFAYLDLPLCLYTMSVRMLAATYLGAVKLGRQSRLATRWFNDLTTHTHLARTIHKQVKPRRHFGFIMRNVGLFIHSLLWMFACVTPANKIEQTKT